MRSTFGGLRLEKFDMWMYIPQPCAQNPSWEFYVLFEAMAHNPVVLLHIKMYYQFRPMSHVAEEG